jgi:hypothetical protein
MRNFLPKVFYRETLGSLDCRTGYITAEELASIKDPKKRFMVEMMGHKFGPGFTEEHAIKFVDDLIQEHEMNSKWRVDGKIPSENSNHDFWKNGAKSFIEEFRERNKSGMPRNGLVVYSSFLEKIEKIFSLAESGEISYKEANRQILVAENVRIAKMKDRINEEAINSRKVLAKHCSAK